MQSSRWTITHKALRQDLGGGQPLESVWPIVEACALHLAAGAVGQRLQTPGTMAGSLRAMGGAVEMGLPEWQGLLTDSAQCLCWGAASGGSWAGAWGWAMGPPSARPAVAQDQEVRRVQKDRGSRDGRVRVSVCSRGPGGPRGPQGGWEASCCATEVQEGGHLESADLGEGCRQSGSAESGLQPRPSGRKQRTTEELLGERGEWKSWLKTQHSKKEDHSIRFHPSWQMDGETMTTGTDFIFLGFKIAADGDYSHEIKRGLLLGRKAMTNIDSILQRRDITLPTRSV